MDKKDKDKVQEKITVLLKEVTPYLTQVNDVIKVYSTCDDIYNLELFETVKRDLIDLLVHVSEAHGKLKYYHTMYDQGRKTVKAEVVDDLVTNQKKTATFASNAVYNEDAYREYMNLQGLIEKAFQLVNSKYYLIDNTLRAVQQSIGVCRGVENK